MKTLISALLLSCLFIGTAQATPQQEKMKTCNAEAATKNLSGDTRKEFMKSCLSGN